MLSWFQGKLLNIGKSKIHGELVLEIKATLDLPKMRDSIFTKCTSFYKIWLKKIGKRTDSWQKNIDHNDSHPYL